MNLFYQSIFLVCFFWSPVTFSLTKEITIDNPSFTMPLTQVKYDGRVVTWSMITSQGANFVGLVKMHKKDVESLLSTSLKAKDFYKEIIDQGRCPKGIIKSPRFGRLISNSNSIEFQVVCEKNNIMVQYSMVDEYGVNVIINKIEWKHLNKLAKDILQHYKEK